MTGTRHIATALGGVTAVLLWGGCGSDPEANRVQDPSKAAPSWFVSVSAADGFVPACKVIGRGDTVQWENQSPLLPANVTSVDEPPALYSPNLQGEFVTWTASFRQSGWFEYYDTNSGDPGRRVVDAYYGTVTFIGASESTHRGAICVPDDSEAPCCCSDLDCAVDAACIANTCTHLEES